MLKYKLDVQEELKKRGYTSYVTGYSATSYLKF